MSELMTHNIQMNPTNFSTDDSSTVEPSNASSNLGVLLLAAAMVTSPSHGDVHGEKASLGNNGAAANDVAGAAPDYLAQCWLTAAASSSTQNNAIMLPTVTPQNETELVDDIPWTALPTISQSYAPPKLTKQHCRNNPFVLPVKKRFSAAAHAASFVAAQQTKESERFHREDDVAHHVPMKKAKGVVTADWDATTTARSSSTQDSPTSTYNDTTNTKKKYRKPQCSHPTCPNRVMNTGVCARHGARVRICSVQHCTKYAQKGGVCIRHGAVKEYKRCVVGGCNSRPIGRGGVCARHASSAASGGVCGPPVASTTAGQEEQTTNNQGEDEDRQDVVTTNVIVNDVHHPLQSKQQHYARDPPQEEEDDDDQQQAAVASSNAVTTTSNTTAPSRLTSNGSSHPRLMSDGTPPNKSSSSRKKKCSMPQCTKQAKVGGLCMKHGGKVKYRFCNATRCNNVTQKGGYCKRHFNDFGVVTSSNAAGGNVATTTAAGGDDSKNRRRLSDTSLEGVGGGDDGGVFLTRMIRS